MMLSENFAHSTNFDPYSLITQTQRKTALSSAELDPTKIGVRDQTVYENGLIALETNSEAYGLKGNSPLNKISHFHVANVGTMAPCLDHDLFAGCAREDVSMVIVEMFKRNIISKELMIKKCFLFKKTLYGTDRRSWVPSLRTESFKTKLPGTMVVFSWWI